MGGAKPALTTGSGGHAARRAALERGRPTRLTLYLAGGGVESASRAYTACYGRAPAPPRYVYEPWFDVINEGEGEAAPNGQGFTGGARVKRDVQTIVDQSSALDIPVGVIGMEGWQAVPGIGDFSKRLRRQGYHLAAYWNMFTSPGTAAYREALDNGYFVRNRLGEPYPIVSNRGGLSYIIDYSNPAARRWWATQLRRSMDLGFEAFMHDFGELTTEGMVFDHGDFARVHNDYPRLYHDAARAAVDAYANAHPGFKPFFYVRAGFNGVHAATPAVFPGDETTDFSPASGLPSVIPAMLNLSLTGSYAFTTDVGGYLDLLSPRTSKQLFIRWAQLAAFTPILRLHNSTYGGSVYPWSFDDETVAIFRRYAKAKMRLIDLVDEWAHRAAATGAIGPVRPLFLDDDSPAARGIADEWLLGKKLLVAPVVNKGLNHRSVYFPAGARWQRVAPDTGGRLVATGAVYDGGQRAEVPVTLADIPVFRRMRR